MFDLLQSVFLIAAAAEAPEGGANSSSAIFAFAPWIVMGVLFYVMLIRPERKKRAELDGLLTGLKKNDRVVTIGGIFGTVVNAPQGSEDVTLKVDESTNTRLRVLRSSISRVVTTESDSDDKSASKT